MNFFEFFSSKYHEEREKVGWPAGGGQLGLAAAFLLRFPSILDFLYLISVNQLF
jgi:hypothetical protein